MPTSNTPIPSIFSFRRSRRLSIVILLTLFSQMSAAAPAKDNPFGDLEQALNPDGVIVADRLAILNLVHAYSHFADGLHTDSFGQFFTRDAVFEVVPYGAQGPKDRQRMGKGRNEIVAALAPRHLKFAQEGIQRRHFLTNPVVWDQSEKRARVAVYLQLRSSQRGGPSQVVATGRYEGVAVKTLEGWRMAEWTIHSDQELK